MNKRFRKKAQNFMKKNLKINENSLAEKELLNKNIVGTFENNKSFGFVVPDNKKEITKDIFISKKNINHAKNGQKVVVKITSLPKNKKPEGIVTEILGYPKDENVDMLSLIKEYDLPYEFKENIIEEAKKVSEEKIDTKNRLDLRKEEIFTIDSEDAKDLDDAVNVKKNSDGTYTLGVHIADVSHYVKEGSLLDKEAIKRGTSIYMLRKCNSNASKRTFKWKM